MAEDTADQGKQQTDEQSAEVSDQVKANQARVDGYLGEAGLPPHRW